MERLVVLHSPRSAALVRRLLHAQLQDVGAPVDLIDDAALVVTELIANSARHARPQRDRTITVEWCYEGGVADIRVTDGGGGRPPRPRRVGPDEESGRGLTIVDALASAWGVDNGDDATTVWARLDGVDRAGPETMRAQRRPPIPAHRRH